MPFKNYRFSTCKFTTNMA